MKNIIFIGSAFCLLLTGCDPISGTINIVEPITAVIVDNSCTPGRGQCVVEKKVQIPTGSFGAQVVMRSKKEAVLTVDVGGNSKQIVFAIPSSKSLPEYSGSFDLTPSETKQAVGITGNLITNESSTQPERHHESCTYETEERRCERNKKGKRECRTITRSWPGTQYVEYYYHTTHKQMQLALYKANAASPAATMQGSHSDTQKVYNFKEVCRRR